MKVLAIGTERPMIRKMLDHLGLPSTGPPIARARRPAEFDLCLIRNGRPSRFSNLEIIF
jgi:hypothetical protein